MKKILKYSFICLLVIFSFYYTNMVSNLFISKSDLMHQINNYKDSYDEMFVNAQINNNYIIPGINGIEVDAFSSYHAMKEKNIFNEELIVTKEISPDDSYYNHTDLIISKGNPIKNSVSIIIKNNNEILQYAINKKLIINRLIDLKTIANTRNYQQINHDFLHYEEVEKILDKNKNNTNICVIDNDNIIDFCNRNGKYLVKPNIYLTNQSILINNKIESGDIIYIDNNFSLIKFKLLLKKIAYENLQLGYLDYVISESR